MAGDSALELARGVWAPGGGGIAVVEGNADGRLHERLLAVGTPGRPRLLISPGRGPLRALRANNRLRAPRERITRLLAGTAAAAAQGVPGGGGILRPLSVVATRPDAEPVTHTIARTAGLSGVRCLVTVRPIDDHYKPTLTMLDDRGEATGYAKLGWTRGTARLVLTESNALTVLDQRVGTRLSAPKLLGVGDHVGRPFCVTAPIDARFRRSAVSLPPVPILRQLAGEPSARPADDVLASWSDAEIADRDRSRLVIIVQRVLRLQWSAGVPSSRSHGDWVPWNTGSHGSRMIAWDWEHFCSDRPAGFDTLHWLVMTRRVLDNTSWVEAYRAALPQADAVAKALGAPDVTELALFHATELLLRSETLRSADGSEPFAVDDVVTMLLNRLTAGRES